MLAASHYATADAERSVILVDAPVLAVCRERKADLLAYDTGEEAADRMGFPLRCTCHRLNGRATWPRNIAMM